MCVCFNNPGKVIVVPVPHWVGDPGKILLYVLSQHFLFVLHLYYFLISFFQMLKNKGKSIEFIKQVLLDILLSQM